MRPELRQVAARGHARGLALRLASLAGTPLGAVGERLGGQAGSSVEFMDFRAYAPGDDLRRLDWAAYARTDRLITRLHREEVTPRCDLLLDASASMDLPDTPKAAAVMEVAGLIAGAADASRFSTRLFALDALGQGQAGTELLGREVPGGHLEPAAWTWPGFHASLEPAAGQRQVQRLGGDRASAGPPASGPSPLPRGGGPLRLGRRGWRVVISDLLVEAAPEALAARFAADAAALTVVQVLAARDANPGGEGLGGDLRLVDAEGGHLREARLDGTALRAYREALRAHNARWSAALARFNAGMVTLVAEDVLAGGGASALIRAGVLR